MSHPRTHLKVMNERVKNIYTAVCSNHSHHKTQIPPMHKKVYI